MKNVFKNFCVAAFAVLAFASCDSVESVGEDVIILSFDDNDSYWSALIDDPQYGGSLLYGTWDSTIGLWGDYVMNQDYAWSDSATGIYFSTSYPYYYGGGIAISNYSMSADSTATANFSVQLSVPFGDDNKGAGNGGSNNFAVANAYSGFNFGTETKTIQCVYVAPTSYGLNSMKNGDYYATALTNAGDYFKVVATGYDASYEVTGTAEFYLAKDGSFVEAWTKWDLSGLGEINSVTFTFEGSDVDSDGYLNTATYFAIDDITVLK